MSILEPAYKFTPADASKGAEVTNTTISRRKAAELARRASVRELLDVYDRHELPSLMVTALSRMLVHLLETPMPALEDAQDHRRMAEAMATVHKMLRLEMGESTSNVATADVSPDRLALLRQRMARVDSAAPLVENALDGDVGEDDPLPSE